MTRAGGVAFAACALALEGPVEVAFDARVIGLREFLRGPMCDEGGFADAAPSDDGDDVILASATPRRVELREFIDATDQRLSTFVSATKEARGSYSR